MISLSQLFEVKVKKTKAKAPANPGFDKGDEAHRGKSDSSTVGADKE